MMIKSVSQNLFTKKKKERNPNIKSVLIVEDDDALRDNMTDLLQSEGYETICAASSSEASKLARQG